MKSIYKQVSGVRQNTGPNLFIIVPVDVLAHNGTKSSANTPVKYDIIISFQVISNFDSMFTDQTAQLKLAKKTPNFKC